MHNQINKTKCATYQSSEIMHPKSIFKKRTCVSFGYYFFVYMPLHHLLSQNSILISFPYLTCQFQTKFPSHNTHYIDSSLDLMIQLLLIHQNIKSSWEQCSLITLLCIPCVHLRDSLKQQQHDATVLKPWPQFLTNSGLKGVIYGTRKG